MYFKYKSIFKIFCVMCKNVNLLSGPVLEGIFVGAAVLGTSLALYKNV